MKKISIIYWSGTGNTEKIAELIEEGAKEAGNEVTLKDVNQATKDDIINADVVALGCPAQGVEELEPAEFLPFYETIVDDLKGKEVAVFGSYGWGGGQMHDEWKEDLISHGAIVEKDPLSILEAPDDEEAIIEFGKEL